MLRRQFLASSALLPFIPSALQAAETIGWMDLLPEDGAIARPVPLTEHDETGLALLTNDANVPLNYAVDGQEVSLTGYVTPISFLPGSRAMKVDTFLLAPFTGACVHVPPPPANQLVLVHYAEGVDLATRLSLDPIEFKGKMSVGPNNISVTVAGYTLEATEFRYVSNARSSSTSRRYLFSGQ